MSLSSPRTRPSWGRHIVGMDGLRGIAAVNALLAVVSQGLTLFFALSGFLLFRPFAVSMLERTARPRTGRFFVNRALRIFPVYVVILLVVSLAAGVAYNQVLAPDQPLGRSSEPVGFMTDPRLLLTNLLMIHSFFPESVRTGLGVSWTLSVELVFYLALPSVAALAARLRSPRLRLAVPVLVFLAIGLLGKLWLLAVLHPRDTIEANYLQWGGNRTAVLARSFLTHSDLFAFGMAAAALVAAYQTRSTPEFRRLLRWCGLVAGVLLAVLLKDTPFGDTGYAILAGAVVLFVGLNSSDAPGWAAGLLELAPLRYVGVISYSLYLWHLPVIWFLYLHDVHFPASAGGFWLNILLVLAISVVLASISYETIEKPFTRLKRRTDSERAPVT